MLISLPDRGEALFFFEPCDRRRPTGLWVFSHGALATRAGQTFGSSKPSKLVARRRLGYSWQRDNVPEESRLGAAPCEFCRHVPRAPVGLEHRPLKPARHQAVRSLVGPQKNVAAPIEKKRLALQCSEIELALHDDVAAGEHLRSAFLDEGNGVGST
jgi:hypothetical protein